MNYNLEELNSTQIYHLMAQTVIPRPIAWIITEDEGVINIAPFSFFMPASANPATVIVSIGNKSDGTIKDTLANIKKTNKCTICMVDDYNLEKMHFSSKELDKSISEADKFSIKTKKIYNDFPPMIENATVAYSCTFNQTIDLGDSRTQPTVLNVKNIFVDDKAFDKNDDKKRTISFDPVARIAREYTLLGDKIEAPVIP